MDVPPPHERTPIPTRIARLRSYVHQFGSLDAAAAALDVRPGTLRRNLERDSATHEALDVIAEGLPEGLSI